MKANIWMAFKVLFILTILTGIIYPFFITGIARVFFKHQSQGSLIISENRIIGSELIGQKFDSAAYFWSRPSAIEYNPLPSGGSNLGPTSDKLKKLAADRIASFKQENYLSEDESVPAEMVFSSASGLDPHVSRQAAILQVDRICKVKNFTTTEKENLIYLIDKQTEKPQFLIFGEERINILLLNLELEKMR